MDHRKAATMPTQQTHAVSPAQAPAPQGPSATVRHTVEWSDTDAAGHHHNSSILRWVEACEARLYRDLGLLHMFGDCPRVQHVVNYTAKLWFGQGTTTTVQVDQVGTSSVRFGFQVHGEAFEGHGPTLAAHGSFVTVNVDPATGRSAPWPDSISVLFGRVIGR
jgi:acyl-CoA thioester hydrolase